MPYCLDVWLSQDLSPYQAAHQVVASPNPLEFLSYVFGLGDLLSGPFFEFSEYKEFMELKGVSGGAHVACGYATPPRQRMLGGYSPGRDSCTHPGCSP
jgi:hypothetical protein